MGSTPSLSAKHEVDVLFCLRDLRVTIHGRKTPHQAKHGKLSWYPAHLNPKPLNPNSPNTTPSPHPDYLVDLVTQELFSSINHIVTLNHEPRTQNPKPLTLNP